MSPGPGKHREETRNECSRFLEYLKSSITPARALTDIVRVFETMCWEPVENSLILFETGTFCPAGGPLFYFSLTRQFPHSEDEDEDYAQIHVDVQYEPTEENRAFREAMLSEGFQRDIFEYIRASRAFAYAQSREYLRVEIYMDET